MRARTWLGLAVVAAGFYYVHHHGDDEAATAHAKVVSVDEPLTETLQALNRPIAVARVAQAAPPRPTLEAPPTAETEGTLRGTTQPNAVVHIRCDAVLTSGGTIADADGHYEIPHLAPGTYDVELMYDDRTETQQIVVAPDGSQGITIDKNYIRSIPVPGRTFEAVLGEAAGTQGDPTGEVGISFSGSSILETEIYIDGPAPERWLKPDGESFTGVTTLENQYIVDEAPDGSGM